MTQTRLVPNGRALDQAKAAATAEIDLKGYVDTERKGAFIGGDCVGKTKGGERPTRI